MRGRAMAATRRGQRAAESLMADTCTIMRPTGTTFDPDTGKDVVTGPEIYTGRCKVQSGRPAAQEPVVGGHRYVVEQIQVHVPVGTGLLNGDQVTITESIDPDLVGLVLSLMEPSPGTFRTAARWSAEVTAA